MNTRPETQALVVLNPIAGQVQEHPIQKRLEGYFEQHHWHVHFHKMSQQESLTAVVRSALGQGCNLVVAVGGDGTVSSVADALVHTDVPLGIIPMGTGNGLAHALGIPLSLEEAVQLLLGEHEIMAIDVLEIDEQTFLLNVGVGVTSAALPQINRGTKRVLGRFAYLWGVLLQAVGFQPRRFTLVIDGVRHQIPASQVMVANGLHLYTPPLDWGPRNRFNDGQFDVYVVRARSLINYATLVGNVVLKRPRTNPHLHHLLVRQSIRIDAEEPLPVHSDGEIIGQTPIHVRLVPTALPVIVPPGSKTGSVPKNVS